MNATQSLAWHEYDLAAGWCAKRNIAGNDGDALPPLLSQRTYVLIDEDRDAFRRRIREVAYGMAMEATLAKYDQENPQ